MMRMDKQWYRPGQININSREARTKRETAYLSTLAALIVFSLLLIVHANPWFFSILLPAIWLATLHFLQSNQNFCVYMGFRGVQNASRSNTAPLPIMSGEAREKDRQHARMLLLISVSVAFVLTLTIISLASIML